MVALGFDVHRGAEDGLDGGLAAAGAQRRAQVDEVVAEQAELEAAVGGQADAVARLAVVVRER